MIISQIFESAFNIFKGLNLTKNVTFPVSGVVVCSIVADDSPDELLDSHVNTKKLRVINSKVTQSELKAGELIVIDGTTWTIQMRESANEVFTVLYIYSGQKGRFQR